ncbi:MAG: hypothetical protein ACLTQG_30735 [Hungatella sp.]
MNTGVLIDPANGVGVSVSCKDPEGVMQSSQTTFWSPEVQNPPGLGRRGR